MDIETTTRQYVDLLERVLLDRNAEPTHVPLSLLGHITNWFSDDQKIGSGGFSDVYKGVVGKGLVAVKKLSKTFDLPESKFHKEVECLMKAKHKNIVRFLGYCSETHGRIADYEGKFVMADLRNWLLCFEYVPNGSLKDHITDVSVRLEWSVRYDIIRGICEGLLHLHEKRILHLDLKPGNILLDDHMVPKIADFGLSRFLDKDQTRVITSNLCGSWGYMAPEFLRGGHVALASDIFSLGVIILEILTGPEMDLGYENVVETWMNRLEGSDQCETHLEQVKVCVEIGIECTEWNPKKRPLIGHINDRLDKMTSTIDTGISSQSVKQHVSFLQERCCEEKKAKLVSEYLDKDIKEHAETKEHVKYVGTSKEDRSQQGREEAPGDKNVIPRGASISSSISGLLYKLTDLDIFSTKARMNYLRYGGTTPKVILFRWGELKPFLKNENFIGKGAFGEVYRGLVGGVPVVVKKLIGGSVPEDMEQFANVVFNQCQVMHKNIVRLRGCCVEVDTPMLVYEFLSKGSLHHILHSGRVPLNLDLRLSIASESSDGLAYMHSRAHCKILHGNFKPANILFGDNYVPKISDFGISRMAAQRNGIIDGEMVYMDPTYLQTGLLTEKSDVYSFGVTMLEIITRRKATHSGNNSLVTNFLRNHKIGRKSKLFDGEIAVAENLELLDNLAEIAVRCLNHDPDERPTMEDVVRRLYTLQKDRLLKML